MTAALYLHIPFCQKRCTYCDFYTVAWQDPPLADYVDLLQREMELWQATSGFADLTFETIFFGGGTPSLLAPEQIERLLNAAFSLFRFVQEPEITLEANPDSVDLERLRGYRAAGVNRLSFGVQSFLPDELARVERLHSPEDARQCVEWARQAGFENVNLDLIFALPGQRFDQWVYNLSRAIALQPEHLSLYNLTIAEGTPLAHRIERSELQPCSEPSQRRMFLHNLEFLEEHGYERYEVSNFARCGFACRHNLKYWDGSPYLGVGASAHSFLGGRRFWNAAHLGRHRDSVLRGVFPTAGEERLTRSQAMFETVFLSLRQRAGLSLTDFERLFGIPLADAYGGVLRRLFPEGFNGRLKPGTRGKWFELVDGRLRLTRQGLLLADALCAEFASVEDEDRPVAAEGLASSESARS